MSFDTPVLRTDLITNGGVDYDFDFPVYLPANIGVFVNYIEQVQGVHYVVRIAGGGAPFESLSDASLPSLGTVRFILAPPSGLPLSIIPLQTIEQKSRYSTENLPVRRIEKDFDLSWFGLRAIWERLQRTPSFNTPSLHKNVGIQDLVEGKVLGVLNGQIICVEPAEKGDTGDPSTIPGPPGAGASPTVTDGSTPVAVPSTLLFGTGFTTDEPVAGTARIQYTPPVVDVIPAGSIFATVLTAAPTGFLLCDGAAVSRIDYAGLFALIDIIYGAGNGTTTFNVPNLKGRVPVGLDIAQTEFDTLAETGGAKTHVLTVPQMPIHRHGLNMVSTTPLSNSGGNSGIQPTGALETADAGGGEAHNNLQPYLVLNYIIKT